ncbi:carboxypeptidase-like regulatory domain-containing protein [Nonlabens sp.]|uniref:carboxypeptidase-like regulatory domain-containing protein n=1 Tax=Nonlabens sp. TaxID=1888209 RepID=UPI003F6A5083
MKNILFFFLLTGLLSTAQKERVQIKGTINSELNSPLLGVTVFNNNSLEGTVTNDDGAFYIDAMVNDELSFKAVQFESFSIKITDVVLQEKNINLTLKADVKQLDDVNVSSTSFMIPVTRIETVDAGLEDVTVENIRTAAVDRVDNTFSDRVRLPNEYEVRGEAFEQSQPRFNMVGLAAHINTAQIARSLDVKNISKDDSVPVENNALILLKNKYSKAYLMDYLGLNEDELLEFKYFAVDHGLTKELVQAKNQLDLLEFLSRQVVSFKNRKK